MPFVFLLLESKKLLYCLNSTNLKNLFISNHRNTFKTLELESPFLSFPSLPTFTKKNG